MLHIPSTQPPSNPPPSHTRTTISRLHIPCRMHPATLHNSSANPFAYHDRPRLFLPQPQPIFAYEIACGFFVFYGHVIDWCELNIFITRTATHGSPALWACFLDESLNKVVKGSAGVAHRLTFYRRVLVENRCVLRKKHALKLD